ncbi:GGDEF domain-containing protein [Klebsiella variicola]|nr:GGDEF domain-containing protein [Klebsiella variicola]
MASLFVVPEKGNLVQRLRLWGLLAIILSGVMATLILRGTYQASSQARQNALIIQELYQLLNAANLLAAERAPSNILLSAGIRDLAAARSQVSQARQMTDKALRQIMPLIPDAQLTVLLTRLQDARRLVDQTSAELSPDQEQIQRTINSMFAVSDTFRDIVSSKSSGWFEDDTSLSGPVLWAVSLSELRDAAGRMGSWLIAPVYTHTPLSPQNKEGLNRTDEQVNMLWRFLAPAGEFPVTGTGRLTAARNQARKHFFEQGRPLINKLISEGMNDSGRYSVTAVGLTESYVTTLIYLESWQHEYLLQLLSDYKKRSEKETGLFIMVLIAMLITVILISANVLVVQFRVLRPLLEAREIIVGMAEGRHVPSTYHNHSRELNQLFHSLDILKIHLEERQELTQQLQSLAETDALTGLFNRRIFESTGNQWISGGIPGDYVYLIIMDLDYFKQINDSHGHPAGDQVLISTASILRKTIREDDIAARIGGEEFAVLMRGNKIAEAKSLAARIQREINNAVIKISDDTSLKITSSYGIAGTSAQHSWPQLVAAADNALYAAKRMGRDSIYIYDRE